MQDSETCGLTTVRPETVVSRPVKKRLNNPLVVELNEDHRLHINNLNQPIEIDIHGHACEATLDCPGIFLDSEECGNGIDAIVIDKKVLRRNQCVDSIEQAIAIDVTNRVWADASGAAFLTPNSDCVKRHLSFCDSVVPSKVPAPRSPIATADGGRGGSGFPEWNRVREN